MVSNGVHEILWLWLARDELKYRNDVRKNLVLRQIDYGSERRGEGAKTVCTVVVEQNDDLCMSELSLTSFTRLQSSRECFRSSLSLLADVIFFLAVCAKSAQQARPTSTSKYIRRVCFQSNVNLFELHFFIHNPCSFRRL